MPQQLYSRGKDSRYLLTRKLGGLQAFFKREKFHVSARSDWETLIYPLFM